MRRSLLVALVATLGALTLLIALAVAAPIGSSQSVPIFSVNDTEDAPDAQLNGICASTHLDLCTLRAAIQEAECGFSPTTQRCTPPGGGIVQLPPPSGTGDFRLTIAPGAEAISNAPPSNLTGDLDISTDIRVDGVGFADSVIDGTSTHRIFDVHAGGTLWLRNLTVQNGTGDYDGATGHEHGGAIHNHGTLTLEGVAVINNSAPPGWGGGGITNAGIARLVNVTVAGNATGLQGGGIENLRELRMLNVTIAENRALAPPGTPAAQGGGIFFAGGTTMFTAATLVAENTGGDCFLAGVTISSSGSNLAGDSSCGFNHPSDRSGDPRFDPSVVGRPFFYALPATSRAVDRGVTCQNIDIRGVSRAQDGNGDGVARCDAGSYEREATAPLTCNGAAATIYVDAQRVIVGGPDNGRPYRGRLLGTSGADVMVGTTGRDRIVGQKRNDVLCGGEKGDVLEGGPGNDNMTGDAAADRFDGGAGKDTVTDFNPGEGDTTTSVP